MCTILTLSENGLSLEDAKHEFLNECNLKNLASSTIQDYNNFISRFVEFCGADITTQQLTPQHINSFLQSLKNRGIRATSTNTYIRHVRAFIYWCIQQQYTPPFKIKLIKQQKKIKEVYTNAEIARLTQKPNISTCNFIEYQTWVLINYLLATGNRVRTIINLKWYDVSFSENIIILEETKNGIQQAIPIADGLKPILREYRAKRGGELNDYVFCNSFGGQSSRHTLAKHIKTYNNSRNVFKSSIHLFRNTFAKMWILNGGDVFRLQKILGHSDIAVTREYVDMFSQDLKRDFEKFNPLDQLMANAKQGRTSIKMR